MRCHGHAINDAVAGVPTAAWARPVQQHLDATLDAVSDSSSSTTRKTLFQGEQGEGSGHDPTAGVGLPGPTEFLGGDADLSIGRAELPLPDPACLTAAGVEEPVRRTA